MLLDREKSRDQLIASRVGALHVDTTRAWLEVPGREHDDRHRAKGRTSRGRVEVEFERIIADSVNSLKVLCQFPRTRRPISMTHAPGATSGPS